MRRYLDKTYKYLRRGNFHGFTSTTFRLFDKKIRPYKYFHNIRDDICGEILFVTGLEVGSTNYYRCEVPKEYLKENGINCEIIYYKYVNKDILDNFQKIIWYTVPYTDSVGSFVTYIKEAGKQVICSFDDFLFEPASIIEQDWYKKAHPEDKRKMTLKSKLYKEFLKRSDKVVVSTKYLARKINGYTDSVFILPNHYSQTLKGYVRDLPNEWPGIMNIGVFSGSNTHDKNLGIIIKPIMRLMNKYEDLKLHIGGEFDLPGELKEYKPRIIKYQKVDMKTFLNNISKVAIVLAPLQMNDHSMAKSEVRATQAALVKRLTIASANPAFKDFLSDKYIADNNENIWYNKVDEFLSDEKKTIKAGEELNDKLNYFLDENTIYKNFLRFLDDKKDI